jgi:WD40 repeat protein
VKKSVDRHPLIRFAEGKTLLIMFGESEIVLKKALVKKLIFSIFLFAVLASACAPQTQAGSLSRESSPVVFTATPIVTSPATIAVETISPSPTPLLSLNPTQIADVTATFLCHANPSYDYLTSPDGKWMAVSCNHDHLTNPSIQIVKSDGTKEWQLSFKGVPGIERFEYERSPGVVGFIGEFWPYHWSKDSRYLFIAPAFSSDLPIGAIPPDGVGLYRFDTQTGQLSPILKFSESSYNFAFSPNDEYYVYSYGLDRKNIHIVNTQTGKDQTIQVPGYDGGAGCFVWSPDGLKFVFVHSDVENQKSSLDRKSVV